MSSLLENNMKAALLVTLMLFPALSQAAGERTAASERVVSRACRSRAPVLVIDNFPGDRTNSPVMDLDGNGTYDIMHGEFVASLVELHGQETIRANVSTPSLTPQVLEVLNFYADKIERGELEISWINFSQGASREFADLDKVLGLRDTINHRNVHEYAQRVLEALWTKKPDLQLRELYDVFQRLARLGVPVIIAAENSGYKEVNFYSLFPNVYSVGELDLAGRKTYYSADNSTVTLWRRGNIESYAVEGGLDFNSDGRADIPFTPVPIPDELLQSMAGKRAESLVSQIPTAIDDAENDGKAIFSNLTAQLPAGLYDTKKALAITLGTGQQRDHYLRTLGEYFYMDGQHPDPLFFVSIDNSGKVVLKQGLRKGQAQYRNLLYGTSFAAPSICNGIPTPDAYAL